MWRTIFQSKWSTIIGIVLIVFLGFIVLKRTQPLASISRDVESVGNKIEAMEIQKKELEEQERYAQNPSTLERQARLQLNYKKPGENVVYIYRQQESKKEVEILADHRSNLKQWLMYVLGD